ncbi:MAG: U32 family peptidase [Clostridia bacterium]|nr:U32 family peptidase [Clostridia bacterium]
MKKLELLAPCGNFSKLKTALYYGADAVYVGGKAFSLRTFADNFTIDELRDAVKYTHDRGKRIYITANIYAKNSDFESAKEYFKKLDEIGVDAIIISDPGLFVIAKEYAPNTDLHISTQANTLNKYSAKFWADLGAKRIILARELSLAEIKEIREYLDDSIELEAFVHGAMCISYSGRCLLSDYFSNRSSNRGACVQACRWNYEIREKSSNGEFYEISEDERGTYILNSKDLNLINYLDEVSKSGVCSFKIEGRMKSEYYLATIINAYRKAIDSYLELGSKYKENSLFLNEVMKTNHRAFTTAYCLSNNSETVNYDDTQSVGERTFIALVLGYDKEKKLAKVEMRNRFKIGDKLEILSPNSYHNKVIDVNEMFDENFAQVEDAKKVQQILFIKTEIELSEGDILRK